MESFNGWKIYRNIINYIFFVKCCYSIFFIMFVAVEKVAKMKGICNALGRESKKIFETAGKSQRSQLEERCKIQ